METRSKRFLLLVPLGIAFSVAFISSDGETAVSYITMANTTTTPFDLAAAAAVDAMMTTYYDFGTGRWQPASPWWQSGNALQCLLDYNLAARALWQVDNNNDATDDSDNILRYPYWDEVLNTIQKQRQPVLWWLQGGGEFRADSTDDTAWWAVSCCACCVEDSKV